MAADNKKLETPHPVARKPAEDGSDSHLWTPRPERWVSREKYVSMEARVIDRFHLRQDFDRYRRDFPNKAVPGEVCIDDLKGYEKFEGEFDEDDSEPGWWRGGE